MRTIAIVGAGTAGCVVARHLTDATAGAPDVTRIVLIERGVRNPQHDAPDFMKSLHDSAAAITHVDARLTADANASTYPYVQASCVGGGGAVNGMVVSPLHEEDFTLWRDIYGCTDWNPHSVIAHVNDLVVSHHIEPSQVGAVGSALIAAGASPATLTWNGARVSGATLIQDAVTRGVLEILHAGVTGLAVDRGRVRGVHTTSGMVSADVVVMAAGAVMTPLLLKESGVVATHLGEQVQDHPSIFFSVQRSTPHNDDLNATALHAMGDTQLIAYESAHPNTPMFGGISLSVLKVKSRGRVVGTLQSPQLELHLLDHRDDMKLMRSAVREFVRSTVPMIEKQCGPVFCDSNGASAGSLIDLTDQELDGWLQAHVVPHSHVAGSCAMGEGPHAVASQRGQFPGVQGLYVADASVFPQLPRSNTNMVTAAVALQMARFIEEDLS